TTAGYMLRDMNLPCRFSAWVDSALAGSQADESFFSAPCSLPAIDPPTAMTASQNTTTTYFIRRPDGIAAIRWAMDLELVSSWATSAVRSGCDRPEPGAGPVVVT